VTRAEEAAPPGGRRRSPWLRFGWRALRTAALAVLGLTGVMMLFEKQLIYIPHRQLELTPAEVGLAADEVFLTTEDRVRIHGWYLPVRGSRRVVLVCHGNAGNISHRLDRALLIQSKLGADVFLFDYRGYGRSEGSPDEQGTYRDARAAYRYVTDDRGLDPDRIVLFGESLGAAVALQLALESRAGAVVLESPFASVPAMARALYPFLPLAPVVRTRYDNLAKIAGLRLPLLVLHGERDEIVPFSQGRQVFEAAPGPKRFFSIARAGHNDTYVAGGDAYWVAWREFLDELALPATEAGSG